MMSDIATLEWVRDRFANGRDKVAVTRLDFLLKQLRNAVNGEEFDAAARAAKALREHVKAAFATK